jgi:hypothetical protein
MNHSTGKRTKAQQLRFDRIKAIGCIACRLRGLDKRVLCEVHHLLSGGRRLGHDFTVGLCPWHHRRVPFGDWLDHANCLRLLGPSLAGGSKPFHAEFGSDGDLLKYQNELLSNFKEARIVSFDE